MAFTKRSLYYLIILLFTFFNSAIFASINNFSSSASANVTKLQDNFQTIMSLALTPNGKELYAVEQSRNVINVIDVEAGMNTHTITLPVDMKNNFYTPLIFAPNGKTAYLASSSRTIYTLDTQNCRLSSHVQGIPQAMHHNGQTQLIISNDGKRLYVAELNLETDDRIAKLYIVDTQTNQLIHSVDKPKKINDLHGWGGRMVMSKDDARLYISNPSFFTSLYVLDTKSNILNDKIELNNSLRDYQIDFDNECIYILDEHFIDKRDLKTGARIAVLFPQVPDLRQLALTPNGKKLFVTTHAYNNAKDILVIDAQTMIVTNELDVFMSPKHMQISGDSKWLYVVHSKINFKNSNIEDKISFIDIDKEKVVRTISIT